MKGDRTASRNWVGKIECSHTMHMMCWRLCERFWSVTQLILLNSNVTLTHPMWQQHTAKKRIGRVFTFWFYLFLRRQKRVMLYKTPLLTVQCAAKGPLRDVSLLLSTVYSFHGHGNFPWRRNFFRKQHKHFFTEQFPHWPCKCRYLLCFCFNLYFLV